MNVRSLDLETVELVPHLLWMEEKVDMTLYTITEWSLVHRNASNVSNGIKMMLTLQRKLMNEMMTTYLPSVLLMLITWATTFFKPYFFEAALSVNLTTMLVMTTIFISVMQMLPATAYVKMVDIWLIFGQLVPFLEVVLLTAMEYIRVGNGSGEGDLTDKKDNKEPDVLDTETEKRERKMYWLKFTGDKHIKVFDNYFYCREDCHAGSHTGFYSGLCHHLYLVLPKIYLKEKRQLITDMCNNIFLLILMYV